MSQAGMNVLTVIGLILGAIGGWLACPLRRDRRLASAMAAMKRDIEFETSLVQQLQDRSASSTRSQRQVLQRIEEGRPEQAKRLLAGDIAAYYESWKANTEHRLTPAIEEELAAIERCAESSASIRAALQQPGTKEQTND
jgi:hypothetical protein